MPFIVNGNNITSSSQMGPDTVLSSAIKNGEIVDADIAAGAAIALTKVPSAAAKGANNDITSLGGLTTPLSIGQGGTGAASLDDHYVLIGSGAGAVTPITPDTAGKVLVSNGVASDPSFQALPADWMEVGRTRNAGAQTTLEVGSLPDRDHYLVKILIPGATTDIIYLTINSDGGNNYNYTKSDDGGAYSANTSQARIYFARADTNYLTGDIEVSAIPGAHKHLISRSCGNSAVNANVQFTQCWGGWFNNANAITTFTLASAANMAAGATMTVYASKD